MLSNNSAIKNSVYEKAQEQGQQLLRQTVIDTAERLLIEKGPDALKVRALTDELGCSTKIIYTMFGGKDGLANALYTRGMTLLREALERIPVTSSPADYLNKISWGYWDFANKYPGYYRLLFGHSLAGFKPDEANTHLSQTVFSKIVEELIRFREAGLVFTDDPVLTATTLSSILHGVVIFNLDGYYANCSFSASQVFELTLKMFITELISGGR